MKYLLISLLLLCAMAQAETGYRLVHPDGTVEFTDQPVPGGDEIPLPQAPTIQFAPATPSPAPPTGGSATGADRQQGGESVSITITSPQHDQTLWHDDSGMSISVSVSPALKSGEKIVINLDGKVVASGVGSSFHLAEVYRGSHTVAASVVGAAGAVLSSSTPVTFHMRQHTVIKPRKPPRLPIAPDPLLPE